MKKFLLLLVFCLSLAQVARSQSGPFYVDSIYVPPYICQADSFEVKIFGMRTSGAIYLGSQSYRISNDTVYANFYFVPGIGPMVPMPFTRKITIPAPNFGVYKVFIRSFYNNSLQHSQTTTLGVCTWISGLPDSGELEKNVSVYPNPTSGSLRVTYSLASTIKSVRLLDLTGKLIRNYALGSETSLNLELKDLPAGVYLLSFQTNHTTFTRKIIKN